MTATTPVASATTDPASPAASGPPAAPSLVAWAVRRALLGMLILTIAVGGAAWLLHASIDPATEVQAAPAVERAG